ncbi:phage portal protein [Allorhizobium taibaishanense]|uniref:Phage portal protein n=2 Tax=Allorhizobium taibaishanense TaxID=887144 RepID=A0A1Q8ZZG1_9HYPH|nr:phage portal protein [Allorhizobium taibaishanense]MBB4007302.1 HK97 family phage portal protein [Allorhizobium taibaishanense]OLP47713.1 phage portal protein [Allorhizobium taibaishanense]
MLSAFRLPFRRAFRAGAPDQAKAAVGPRAGVSVMVSGLGARGTGRSYAALSRSGFLGNPVAHRAVRLVSEAAAAVPLLLYRGLPQQGARELTGHPVLTLLARPSSRATGTDLFETLYGHLLLSGNAYLEPLFLGARLAELHLLRPDRVTVVEGADGWPLAYDYRAAGVSRRIPAEGEPQPILHLKLFHPLDDLTGYAPLAAAHNALDLHNAAAAWNKALLDNSARPSGALVYQPKEGGNLPPDQYERLKAELEAGYSGPLQAGRPMLLEGGLDWKAMSLTPRDMDFTDARNGAARDIALSLGVPPMLLGIPGDNTYANYQEANRAFYRLTVLPLIRRTLASLSGFLSDAFGDMLTLQPDLDQVEGLSAERDALWTRVGAADFLSDEEKRQAVGYGD